MDLGWKRLIPLSLGWLLIVAGFVVDGWWGIGMAAAVVVAAVVITRAFAVGAERGESRAVIPQVGVRLWSRPTEETASPSVPAGHSSPTSPASPSSSEGGDG
jgi:putative exporter of polyketide antibiotics